MKLAEALLEKEHLDNRLELLKSRLLDDLDHGRPTSHVQSELQRAAAQARDIAIAIAWTEQISALSGIPLGAYRIRIQYLLSLAKVFEHINQEKADEYWKSAHQELKVVSAAAWIIDLKVPGTEDTSKEEI